MNAEAKTVIPAVIYTALAQRRAAVELVEAGMVLVEKSEKYQTILSDGDAEVVAELRARLKKHGSELDNERLATTQPARDVQASLNAEFDTPIKAIAAAVKRIDAALNAHFNEKKRLREEADRKAREEQDRIRREHEAAQRRIEEEETRAKAAAKSEAEAKAAEERAAADRKAAGEAAQLAQQQVAVPRPVETSVRGTYGSTVRQAENWKWKVTDITKVPENFLVTPEERVQRSVLNALAKSQKGQAAVPGIEFYNESIIANTKVGS